MPEVATHLLASFDGYTTKGRSKTVLDSECKDLEELVFGQPDDQEILHKLTTVPTAMVRRLQSSGRYALSRILPGQADSAGRQSICVCTLVLDVAQYVAIAKGDLWKLLNQPQLWQVANFSANKPLSIPTIAPETRATEIKDVRLFDAWLKATSIQKGLAVPTSDEITDADIVRLTQVLDVSDVPRYLWGCRLFSPQVPVQIATFVKEGIAKSGRRTVVSLTSQLQTQVGSVALSKAVGKTNLPPSIAKAIPVPTSALDYDTPLEDMQAIGLDPESDTWSKPRTSVRRSSSEKPKAIKAKSSAVMWIWIAAAASLLVTTGIASVVIWKLLAPPQSTKNLQIVSDQLNQIRLTWEKASENATYKIERSEIEKPSAQDWIEIKTNWAETTLDDTEVKLGQRYWYRIITLKKSSITSKDPSNIAWGYCQLQVPKINVSSGDEPNTFKIEWENPNDNLIINLCRGTNTNDVGSPLMSDKLSPYIDSATKPGVNYFYTAYFTAKDTEIAKSKSCTPVEMFRKLESPTGLTVSQCELDITLRWQPSENATKYQVFMRKKGENTWAELSQPNEPTFTDTKIEDGEIYEYTVEAQKEDNKFNSEKSPQIKGWSKPAEPTNVKVIPIEKSNNVTLSWNYHKGLTYKIKRNNIEIINQPKDQEATATDTLPDPLTTTVQFTYTITAEFLPDETGQPCTSEPYTTTYPQPAKIIVAPPVTAPPPTTPPNNPDKPEDICGKLTINGKKIPIVSESQKISLKKIIPPFDSTTSITDKETKLLTTYEKLITEVKDVLKCLNEKTEIYYIFNTQIRKDLRTELRLSTSEADQHDSFWNGIDEELKIKFQQELDVLDTSANKKLYEKVLELVILTNNSESILQETLEKMNFMPVYQAESDWRNNQLAPFIQNLLQLCKSYGDNKNKLENDYEQFRSNKTNKKIIELNNKIEVQEEELKVFNETIGDKQRAQVKIKQGNLNLTQFKAEQKKLSDLLKTLKPDIKQCLRLWLQQLIQHAGYKKTKGLIESPNSIEIEIEKLQFVYEHLEIPPDVLPEPNPADAGDHQ